MQNKYWTANTLESGISIRVRLLISEVFSRGYILIKGATFIDFWFKKHFLRIFNFLFLLLCIKESNHLLFKRGLRLFKGLCLLFLPNVPGAMFIQGDTFIPDSRVFSKMMPNFWQFATTPNNFIWIQFTFKQKSFLSCIPPLKTPQPVLPWYSWS